MREPPPWVRLGIGDDAAILEPDRGALDRRDAPTRSSKASISAATWTAPRSIGHKALAVNLSDLAAMGAAPRASLLSLALPTEFPVADFDELLDGFVALANNTDAALVGGNIARSPGPLVVDVTALGAVGRRRWLQRGGGQAGDELYVTGELGAAACGLKMLEAAADPASLDESERECLARYQRPEARLRMGQAIGRNQAAVAAIDLSDGLADGARQIAAASGTGVVIDADRVPVHPGVRRWASRGSEDALSLALSGGEDYELLFLVRPRRRLSFLAAARKGGKLQVTLVGRLTREPGASLDRAGQLEVLPSGFEH